MSEMTGYVIGSPITHSKSPTLHLAAYRALGLDWGYRAVEVAQGGLGDFMSSLRPKASPIVSVTMPLKVEAALFASQCSPLVEVTGIANTLISRNDEWFADNTDVFGITRTLEDRAFEVTPQTSITVLGTGATAASTIAALSQLGAKDVRVVGRNKGAIEDLTALANSLSLSLKSFDLAELEPNLDVDLVVSTWPTQVAAELVRSVPGAVSLLFDITYDPWPSEVAKRWFVKGGDVVGGLDLLVNQASAQIELATGEPAPIEIMRASVGLPR